MCPIIGNVKYYADPTTRLCSQTCTNTTSIPLVKNDVNLTCVSSCQPGFFMDPNLGACKNSCSQNLYADNSTRLCVSVCPISPYLFGENGTYTCVENCLVSSQFKYIAGRMCVVNCPSGTFRDNNTRVCEYTCTNYTYADSNTSYCVSNCTPRYSYDPTHLCVSSCSSPYYKDPTTYKCVITCPTYPLPYFQMIDSNGDRKCDTNCPSGQFRNF